jgi:hypothetical protein
MVAKWVPYLFKKRNAEMAIGVPVLSVNCDCFYFSLALYVSKGGLASENWEAIFCKWRVSVLVWMSSEEVMEL